MADDLSPMAHYEANSDMYDYISEQVHQTADYFARASRDEQELLLNRGVTFALLSTQTAVDLHEQGYVASLYADSYDDTEQALLDSGVNYYKNKTKYIFHNLTEPDVDRVLDHYEDGDLDRAHRAIADEYMGVGLRKAGFAMALTMTPEKCCIDTHVAQMAGLDENDVYNGTVVDRYEAQCDEIFGQWSELDDTLSRFMAQWVAFDADMGTVTTHDPWFLSLPTEPVVSSESGHKVEV